MVGDLGLELFLVLEEDCDEFSEGSVQGIEVLEFLIHFIGLRLHFGYLLLPGGNVFL